MAKSFKRMTALDTSNVLVVDSLNLCFRFLHRKQTEFVGEFIETIKSLARSYKCGRIILTGDYGASTYRRDLLPEYKMNRKKENQTEDEKAAFYAFIDEYNNCLEEGESIGITTLKYKGVEADDLAAYLVKYKKEFGFNNIWLISSDRDWDLLVQENVSRFSFVTRKEVLFPACFGYDEKVIETEETEETKWPYDVSPEHYLTLKCLQGDSGDNIAGCPGVGPKRALELIKQYGDVFEIYNNLPLPGKYKYIQNLNEFKDNLLLNVELMDLLTYCEEAIGEENLADIRSKL